MVQEAAPWAQQGSLSSFRPTYSLPATEPRAMMARISSGAADAPTRMLARGCGAGGGGAGEGGIWRVQGGGGGGIDGECTRCERLPPAWRAQDAADMLQVGPGAESPVAASRGTTSVGLVPRTTALQPAQGHAAPPGRPIMSPDTCGPPRARPGGLQVPDGPATAMLTAPSHLKSGARVESQRPSQVSQWSGGGRWGYGGGDQGGRGRREGGWVMGWQMSWGGSEPGSVRGW